MYLKLYFLSIILLLVSCSDRNNDKILSVGTFNIKWLGDGINDRVERDQEDYKAIADIIRESDVDIMALQEIENREALKMIIKHLPNWKYIIEDDGYLLNLAFIAKDDIQLEKVGLYKPFKVLENRTRSGFIAKAKKGNFDFYLMNLHFKATSGYDNTPQKRKQSFLLRQQQSDALDNWIDSILQFSEQDLIILGDFNDNPKREWSQNLASLADNQNISFLTSDLESCKNPEKWDVIDHIVISNSAHKRYLMGSAGMFNFYSSLPENKAEIISDHCPVTAVFNVVPKDND